MGDTEYQWQTKRKTKVILLNIGDTGAGIGDTGAGSGDPGSGDTGAGIGDTGAGSGDPGSGDTGAGIGDTGAGSEPRYPGDIVNCGVGGLIPSTERGGVAVIILRRLVGGSGEAGAGAICWEAQS